MNDLTSGFYDIMNYIIPKDNRRLSSTLFTDDWLGKLKNETERNMFVLFRKISSLSVEFKQGIASYHSGFLIDNEGKSFNVTDMTEDDFTMLGSLEIKRIPLTLRARISNIIWNQKKDIKMAEIAIESYYELYRSMYDLGKWGDCIKYLRHTICLATKTKKQDVAENLLEIVQQGILEINGRNKLNYSLKAIELLTEQNLTDITLLLDVLDNIIKTAQDNVDIVEKAYDLKTDIFNKKNKVIFSNNTQYELAKYLENAETIQDGVRELSIAEKNLKKAITIYKKLGKKIEKEEATRKLTKVQKEIPKYMIPFSTQMDASEDYKNYISLFEKLNFKEAVVRLTQTVRLISKAELEAAVLENAADPLACLFGVEIKNEKGQTVVKIPSLNINNPKNNVKAFEMHMHREALLREKINGNVLRWGMQYINDNYHYEKEDLSFLVEDNPIIPVGRNKVMLSAFYYGLKGDIYEAIHILAPQMENLFRSLAEELGSVMTELKNDYTDQAKLLTSIFDDDILNDCYDNDILFLFKGLLNEKSGSNIRNEIAHGILTSGKGNGSEAVYFYCLALKVITYTSTEYKEIKKCIYSKMQDNESYKDVCS